MDFGLWALGRVPSYIAIAHSALQTMPFKKKVLTKGQKFWILGFGEGAKFEYATDMYMASYIAIAHSAFHTRPFKNCTKLCQLAVMAASS